MLVQVYLHPRYIFLLCMYMYIYIFLEVTKGIGKITDINLQWISNYLFTFIPELSTQIIIIVSKYIWIKGYNSCVVLKQDYQWKRETRGTKSLIPTTFLQSIFLWKTVNVVWHSIRKESVFLLTDPVTVPYHIYKGVDFPLNYWYHHICQEKPVKK